MRRFGYDEVSRLLEPCARIEQVGCQIAPAHVDAETLDQTATFHDGAAGLPEHTSLAWTRLRARLGAETEHAAR